MINLPSFDEFLNESILRTWTKMSPIDFKKFKEEFLKLDSKYRVDEKPDYDDLKIYTAYKKGNKKAIWRYVEDDYKIYSDMSDKEIWKIQRGNKSLRQK